MGDGADGLVIQRGRGGRPKIQAERCDGWSAHKQAAFLEQLATSANVSRSLKAVGMGKSSLYRLRQRSPAFRAAWDEALREAYALLETEMLGRALNGRRKTIWYGGKRVGSRIDYDDRHAMNLLRLHRRIVTERPAAAGFDRDAAIGALANGVGAMAARNGALQPEAGP